MSRNADTEVGNQMDSIATKVITVSENGPGAYTVMIQRFNGEGHRPLGRVGFSGWYTTYMRLDQPPYTADYDVRRWLRSDDFLARDSPIRDFFLKVDRDPRLFHLLVDGEKYEEEELVEMIEDGSG